MTIRAVIFDIGGVLSHRHNLSALDHWVDRLNRPAEQILYTIFDGELSARATIGQVTVDEIWHAANQQFALSEDDLQAFITDVWATQTWNTDLLDYIRTLKADYKIGALSDAWPDARVTNTAITPDLFDAIVYSAEEGLKKPDPAFYRLILARLDVQPAEAIFVDDSPHKVEGARQVGMHSLLFTDTDAIREEITALLNRA